jgi:hypothetical protein
MVNHGCSNHSSRTCIATRLKQPTREQRGPRQCSPIWSCSGWGLPCHCCYQQRGALLPHHFTLTASVAVCGGIFSVALAVGSHLPGITWHPALWSPDFPPRLRIHTRMRGDCPADFDANYNTPGGFLTRHSCIHFMASVIGIGRAIK